MEEILASIRRIISEDEAPAADATETPPHGDEMPAPETAQAAPAESAPAEPAPPPVEPPPPEAPEPEEVQRSAETADEDEALELTDRVETHGDLDVYTPSEPPPTPALEPAPAPPPAAAAPSVESLVSDRAASAAASAFGQLSAAIAMPHPDRTLEDVVRELLRPLLQQWLDDNLPGIVSEAVRAEVERIARGRVR